MKKVIKNILVPVNFSTSSEKAVQVAIAMCKRHGACLHLLKVNQDNNFVYPSGKNALLIGMRLESKVADIQSMEAYSKNIAEKNGVSCYYHVTEGHFAKMVSETARNFICDLIILETPANSARISSSFDRDAYDVIKTAACPVMTVPKTVSHEKFRSILLPVAQKSSSLTKLQVTLPIIEKNDSKVVLIGSVKTPNDVRELNMVYKLLRSISAFISLSTNNIEKEVTDSQGAAKDILRKAVEKQSDLIVISDSARSGFLSLFRRSNTRSIINNSTVPVLSIK